MEERRQAAPALKKKKMKNEKKKSVLCVVCANRETHSFAHLLTTPHGMDDADGLASPVAVAAGADDPAHAKLYPPPARVSDGAHVASLQAYRDEYAASIADPAGWWSRKATETLSWFRPFSPGAACGGSFEVGDVSAPTLRPLALRPR